MIKTLRLDYLLVYLSRCAQGYSWYSPHLDSRVDLFQPEGCPRRTPRWSGCRWFSQRGCSSDARDQSQRDGTLDRAENLKHMESFKKWEIGGFHEPSIFKIHFRSFLYISRLIFFENSNQLFARYRHFFFFLIRLHLKRSTSLVA